MESSDSSLSPAHRPGAFGGSGAQPQDGDACYHGGAFFDAIGRDFDHLDRITDVINADVLDAWFPPSPLVTEALSEHLEWATRTSPPTASEGLTERIAASRGVAPASILAGAGSSDLIFLALPRWLSPSSRVLITDPGYGEYAHVFENVIGCSVTRLELHREDNYSLGLEALEQALGGEFDLVVLVNPNNPTGQHVPREGLEGVLRRAPASTVFWLDETYVDFVGEDQSLERFAAGRSNVVVCKSMSKAYALSGLRVGYLCAHPSVVESLRRFTPPWAVSLPAQLAAVRALQAPMYYQDRYQETHDLRAELTADLEARTSIEVVPGVANYLLCHLPADGPDASAFLSACQQHNLFLRDVSLTSPVIDSSTFRTAVKDLRTNRKMVEIIERVLSEMAVSQPSAP